MYTNPPSKTPWKFQKWNGEICLLRYPKQTLSLPEDLGFEIQRNTLFIRETPQNRPWEEYTEEIPLPSHPTHPQSLENLPLVVEEEKILLCSQNWTLICPTGLSDDQPPPVWKEEAHPIVPETLLTSALAHPKPHRLFLSECLKALEIEKTGNGQLSGQPWPKNLHLSWLHILEGTQASPHPNQAPPSSGAGLFLNALQLLQPTRPSDCVIFPKNPEETNSLLQSLKRGIIVSMALQRPEELPAARTFLISKKQETPTDKTWKSLANLAQKPHDLSH